ncbi:MAG: hypothetical protein JWO06_2754 [Bacteroidota bacterium]|nr:hypothetical protein [Bacteroidota bacterium]
MEYKASLDSTTVAITLAVFIIFGVVGYFTIRKLIIGRGNKVAILISTPILLFFVLQGLEYRNAPKCYFVDKENLTVVILSGNKKIKLSDIRNARTITPVEMEGTMRTNGTGGFFGYYGAYDIPKIGNATFYATQRRNRVLIVTKQNNNIVITPDDTTIIEKLNMNAAIKR